MKESDDRKLESVADSLLFSFPMFFKRLSREDAQSSVKKFDPSRFVLMAVMRHGPMPMSEIGKRMDISKPYMTALVDRLIGERLVERLQDRNDRRIVNIAVTKAGREHLAEFKRSAIMAVKKNLSTLSPEDIAILHESMEKIKKIILKVDQGRKGEIK